MIHVKGDIWDIARIAAQAGPIALGHGVNCRGVMGAGIALQFREQFPTLYNGYMALFQDPTLLPENILGDRQMFSTHLMVTPLVSRPVIAVNLFTQVNPGADARLDAIKKALDKTFEYFRAMVVTYPLIIPMIGAGIGGLHRDEVLGLFAQYDHRLVVVEYDK